MPLPINLAAVEDSRGESNGNHTTPVGVRYEGAARMLKEHSGLEIAINNYDLCDSIPKFLKSSLVMTSHELNCYMVSS